MPIVFATLSFYQQPPKGVLVAVVSTDHSGMAVAAGQAQAPRLGDVLIAYGVVTPQQLDVALEEQRQTGRPLGEIIVEKGFAPGPMVAQALATQHGGMVKTEYGFAVGFQAPARPEEEALREAIAVRDQEIARLRGIIERLRAECIAALGSVG
jgi:hypothetical protein